MFVFKKHSHKKKEAKAEGDMGVLTNGHPNKFGPLSGVGRGPRAKQVMGY